jgi:hypothetical protein
MTYIIEGSTDLSKQINKIVTYYSLFPNAVKSFSATFNMNELPITKLHINGEKMIFLGYIFSFPLSREPNILKRRSEMSEREKLVETSKLRERVASLSGFINHSILRRRRRRRRRIRLFRILSTSLNLRTFHGV